MRPDIFNLIASDSWERDRIPLQERRPIRGYGRVRL